MNSDGSSNLISTRTQIIRLEMCLEVCQNYNSKILKKPAKVEDVNIPCNKNCQNKFKETTEFIMLKFFDKQKLI